MEKCNPFLQAQIPLHRIDSYNASPFSKFAKEQALEFALMAGHITFEEYVSALEDDSNAPKAKFEKILKNRDVGAFGMGGMPFGLPPIPGIDNALGGVV